MKIDINALITAKIIGGGGGGLMEKIATQEFAVNTTSTSSIEVGTISLGASAWTSDKLIYVHIYDKAGATDGKFVATHSLFANYYPRAGVSYGINPTCAVSVYYQNHKITKGYAGSPVGVFPGLDPDGTLKIRAQYSSNYSKTINGTYVVDVYFINIPPLNDL